MTCYCDGTAHRWRFDYCERLPVHDPNTRIERARQAARIKREQENNDQCAHGGTEVICDHCSECHDCGNGLCYDAARDISDELSGDLARDIREGF